MFLCSGLFFFYALVKLLPSSAFSRVADPFLWVFVSLVVPKKRIVKNLTAAFGKSYSYPTKKGLAKGVQEQFIQNLLDCFEQISDPNHTRQTIPVKGIEHQYHGGMELVIEREIEMTRNGSLANDIAQDTQRAVSYLESLIRRYPDQWNWLTVRMTEYQKGNFRIDS